MQAIRNRQEDHEEEKLKIKVILPQPKPRSIDKEDLSLEIATKLLEKTTNSGVRSLTKQISRDIWHDFLILEMEEGRLVPIEQTAEEKPKSPAKKTIDQEIALESLRLENEFYRRKLKELERDKRKMFFEKARYWDEELETSPIKGFYHDSNSLKKKLSDKMSIIDSGMESTREKKRVEMTCSDEISCQPLSYQVQETHKKNIDKEDLTVLSSDEAISSIDPEEETKKILQETKCSSPKFKKQSLEEFLNEWREFMKPQDIVVTIEDNKKGCCFMFRYLNLLRALLTSVYGIYTSFLSMDDPVLASFNLHIFFVCQLGFLFLDLFGTMIKAFPQVFLFWRKSNEDFFTRSFSIWQIIADLELILDIAPLLANAVLRVFSYRLQELVIIQNQFGIGSEFILTAEQLTSFSRTKIFNLSLIIIYAGSIAFTVIAHTLRISRKLVQKGAVSLSTLVILKSLLLMFDMTCNALLLYSTLVLAGNGMFSLNLNLSLVLSIVSVSPVITMMTNVLVNFPLHLSFIRLLLKKRLPTTITSLLPQSRIVIGALRKTFHPLILCTFGLYLLYSVGGLGYVLVTSRGFTINDLISISTNLAQSDFLYAVLWLNLIANYMCGLIASVGYILFSFLATFFGAISQRK